MAASSSSAMVPLKQTPAPSAPAVSSTNSGTNASSTTMNFSNWTRKKNRNKNIDPENMPKLFNYQQGGIDWMCDLYRQKKGGILADEMGLGKTIQGCAFMNQTSEIKLGLILCPLSLVENWVTEAKIWAPRFKVIGLRLSSSMSKKRKELTLRKRMSKALIEKYCLGRTGNETANGGSGVNQSIAAAVSKAPTRLSEIGVVAGAGGAAASSSQPGAGSSGVVAGTGAAASSQPGISSSQVMEGQSQQAQTNDPYPGGIIFVANLDMLTFQPEKLLQLSVQENLSEAEHNFLYSRKLKMKARCVDDEMEDMRLDSDLDSSDDDEDEEGMGGMGLGDDDDEDEDGNGEVDESEKGEGKSGKSSQRISDGEDGKKRRKLDSSDLSSGIGGKALSSQVCSQVSVDSRVGQTPLDSPSGSSEDDLLDDDNSNGFQPDKFDGDKVRDRLSRLKALSKRLSHMSEEEDGARRQLNFTVLMDDDDCSDEEGNTGNGNSNRNSTGPHGTPILQMELGELGNSPEKGNGKRKTGPNGTPVLNSATGTPVLNSATGTPVLNSATGTPILGHTPPEKDDKDNKRDATDAIGKNIVMKTPEQNVTTSSAILAKNNRKSLSQKSRKSVSQKSHKSQKQKERPPPLPIDFPNHLFPGQSLKWDVVLVDEAHKAKDPASTISFHLRHMKAKAIFLLTGTPIQNELKDMWSLMDVCNPGTLGNMQSFNKHFAAPIARGNLLNSNACEVELKKVSLPSTISPSTSPPKKRNVLSDQLRELTGPYILRRTKKDVKKLEGISKTDIVLWLKPTDEQVNFYKNVLENTAMIREAKTATTMGPTVFRAIGFLKKICTSVAMCHPEFLAGVGDEDNPEGGDGENNSKNGGKNNGNGSNAGGKNGASGVNAKGNPNKSTDKKTIKDAKSTPGPKPKAKGKAKAKAGAVQEKKRSSFTGFFSSAVGFGSLGSSAVGLGSKLGSTLGSTVFNTARGALGAIVGGKRKRNKAEEELIRQAEERRKLNKRRDMAEKAWGKYITVLKESVDKELIEGVQGKEEGVQGGVQGGTKNVDQGLLQGTGQEVQKEDESGKKRLSLSLASMEKAVGALSSMDKVVGGSSGASTGEGSSSSGVNPEVTGIAGAGGASSSAPSSAPVSSTRPGAGVVVSTTSVLSSVIPPTAFNSVASSGQSESFASISPNQKENNIENKDKENSSHANSDLIDTSLISRPTSASKLCAQSAKLSFLKHFVPKLIERGHRVLVFSSSTRVLDMIMVGVLKPMKIRCLRIDGTVDVGARNQKVQRFQAQLQPNHKHKFDVFLSSTQVGGVGLTLTAADRVILVDPSWNPACDHQAIDRAYRVGQLKSVVAYRLILSGLIEEKMFRYQMFKMGLTASCGLGGSEGNEGNDKESRARKRAGVRDAPRYFSDRDIHDLFEVFDATEKRTAKKLVEKHGVPEIAERAWEEEFREDDDGGEDLEDGVEDVEMEEMAENAVRLGDERQAELENAGKIPAKKPEKIKAFSMDDDSSDEEEDGHAHGKEQSEQAQPQQQQQSIKSPDQSKNQLEQKEKKLARQKNLQERAKHLAATTCPEVLAVSDYDCLFKTVPDGGEREESSEHDVDDFLDVFSDEEELADAPSVETPGGKTSSSQPGVAGAGGGSGVAGVGSGVAGAGGTGAPSSSHLTPVKKTFQDIFAERDQLAVEAAAVAKSYGEISRERQVLEKEVKQLQEDVGNMDVRLKQSIEERGQKQEERNEYRRGEYAAAMKIRDEAAKKVKEEEKVVGKCEGECQKIEKEWTSNLQVKLADLVGKEEEKKGKRSLWVKLADFVAKGSEEEEKKSEVDRTEQELATEQQTNTCLQDGAPNRDQLQDAIDKAEQTQVDLEFCQLNQRNTSLGAVENATNEAKRILKDVIKGGAARTLLSRFLNASKAQAAWHTARFKRIDHETLINQWKSSKKQPGEDRLKLAKEQLTEAQEALSIVERSFQVEELNLQKLEKKLSDAEELEGYRREDWKKGKEKLKKMQEDLKLKKGEEKKKEKESQVKTAEFGVLERQFKAFEEKKKRGLEALRKEKYHEGQCEEMYEKRNQKKKRRIMDSQGTQDSDRGGGKRAKK